MIRAVKSFVWCGIFAVVGILCLWTSSAVMADELSDPKEETVTVTAQVQAKNPPPHPFLISPTNGALLRSGEVEFRWHEVTGHNRPLDRYEISLNGSLWYKYLHVVDQETDWYTLDFDGGVAKMKLKPNARLADGTYTWKIRVVDSQDLGTDSTTWTFTVDSTASPLIVTQVGPHETNVSASDATTFPTEPYVVRQSRPTVAGVTESFSELQLAVTRGDGTIERYKTTLGGYPGFSITLNALSPNEVVHLTFTAIDPAGNTTVLDAIDITYVPRVIQIPLPPIIPGLPVIEIPIPEIPVPPILQPTPTPTPQPSPEPSVAPGVSSVPTPAEPPVYQVYERPVRGTLWWLWASLLLFGLGGVIVAWLVGVGIHFWWWWPQWWWIVVWPGSNKRHRVCNEQTKLGLAWLPIELHWVDAQRKLRLVRTVSNDLGNWSVREVADRVYQWGCASTRWLYPVAGTVSDERQDSRLRVLHLHGESFQTNSDSQSVSTADIFVIPPDTSFQLVAWVRPLQRAGSVWRFAPRLCWWLAVALAVWGAYVVPAWWSWCWVLFLFWWTVRDLVLHSPRILKEYAQ